MHIARKALTVLAFFATATWLQAAKVDITMVANNDGQLEIKLRPQANFDGVVSSLVFTLKWDAATEAHLGAIQQSQPALAYLPVSRSGGEQDDGGNRYQIFVGFGLTPMQWIPTDWVAGQEYTIATIPVTGTAEFSLVNNTWTALNNADYYLALGGVDETGDIYGDISTGVVAGEFGESGFTVMPNPTDKATTIILNLHKPQDMRFELLNAAGQAVWKGSRPAASGSLRIPLDLSTFSKGAYLLRVYSGDQVFTRRVVKR